MMRVPTRKTDRVDAVLPQLFSAAKLEAQHALQIAIERRDAAQDRLTACDRLVAAATRKFEETE
jgi:hypothetical protein